MKQKRTFISIISIITAGFLFAAVIFTGVTGSISTATAAGGTPVFTGSDLFTDRDLNQTSNLSDAVTYTVTDGTDIRITEAGTYVLSGTGSDVTVYVEAADDAKVQLVLQNLYLTNSDFPCIYVLSADKVFLTTSGDSSLAVTGSFRTDGNAHSTHNLSSRLWL